MVAAFLLAGTPALPVAPYVFELGVALLAHSALRLIWLLRQMMEAVHNEDEAAFRKTNSVSFDDLGDL